jgi:hypothetical protein
MCITDFVSAVAGMNQVPTKLSMNAGTTNSKYSYYTVSSWVLLIIIQQTEYFNKVTQVSKSLFSKNTKGLWL